MSDSAFSTLLKAIRAEGSYNYSPSLILGKITKGLPNIEILADKMPLYKEDLLINKSLLDRNSIKTTTYTTDGHNHSIDSNIANKLAVGDMVLLAKFPNQEKLIIICKVVSV